MITDAVSKWDGNNPKNPTVNSILVTSEINKVLPYNMGNLPPLMCRNGGKPNPLKDTLFPSCDCPDPWTGPLCQFSSDSTCNSNGIVNNTGHCVCNTGFTGVNCQYKTKYLCAPKLDMTTIDINRSQHMAFANDHDPNKWNNLYQHPSSCQWANLLNKRCDGSISKINPSPPIIPQIIIPVSQEICPAGNSGATVFPRTELLGMDWAKAVFNYCDTCKQE